MRARNKKRQQAAAARATRRSLGLGLLGCGLGAALIGGLLMMSPSCLTPQLVAAQVLRGEKIGNLSITTETNLTTLTNASFVPPNPPASATNLVGLPLAPEVTNTTLQAVQIEGDTYQFSSFGKLAGFGFRLTEEMLSMEIDPQVAKVKVLEQIPPDIKKLNERAVALTGYMLPVKLHEGRVTDFMLLPNTTACCYGRMPRINEIVIVNTTGKGFKPMKDIAITIAGTFHVGAIRNDNRLIGIYQMDCEHVVEAASLKP